MLRDGGSLWIEMTRSLIISAILVQLYVEHDLFWIEGKVQVGVLRMYFALVLGSGFILVIGRWISSLSDFSPQGIYSC